MPGTLGSLEWARVLHEAGVQGVTLGEVDTAPYVCRKTSPDTATIWGVVTGLGLGVLPATRTEAVREMLEPLFPGVNAYPDVMACGLSAMNPVVHPPGVLMNAGRVEYSRGEFYFYEEGVSPSVAKVIMEVDRERREVGRALGYDLTPADEAFHRAGFGPRGDLWATINGSRMLTQLKAPGVLHNRWLTEDIPYGLAAWSLVGAQYGVDTPVMKGVVDIGSIVMGIDGWTAGRGVEELGIAGMDQEALAEYLRTGVID
jgi:opine dehydrogenase